MDAFQFPPKWMFFNPLQNGCFSISSKMDAFQSPPKWMLFNPLLNVFLSSQNNFLTRGPIFVNQLFLHQDIYANLKWFQARSPTELNFSLESSKEQRELIAQLEQKNR
jgi:hypothetical protein